MIGIKTVTPELVDNYHKAIKAVYNRKKLKYKYDYISKWFLKITKNKYDFEKVIKATPKRMEKIIKLVAEYTKGKGFTPTLDSKGEPVKKEPKGTDYSISQYILNTMYSTFSNGHDKNFVSHGFTAFTLLDELNLATCPYCNRNFIISTYVANKKGTKEYRRTAEFDHFYPKSEYSYLAVSFYNLVPSCGCCNKTKLTEAMEVNPYTIVNSDENLIFDIDFEKGLTDLEITTLFMSKAFESNWSVLGLEHFYSQHKDYAADLYMRILMYNSLYRNDLKDFSSKISGTTYEGVISEQDIIRMILGNYFREEDLHKHVLTKLTKDIVRKYKF